MHKFFAMACCLLSLTGSAHAGGESSAPPPTPPAVDLSTVPSTADVQPKNPDATDHPVRARLLAENTSVAPGGTARLGLLLVQAENWHTYWKSPGDIGLPTDAVWTLPEGVAVTQHEYPVPQRFDQQDQVSFGYENQVLLISDLSVADSVAPGTYPIRVDVSWLVCLTSCIPGDATLSMDLIVSPDEPAATPYAPLFPHYAAQHPTAVLDVETFAVETALSHSAIQPNKPFKAVIKLTPTGADTLEGVTADALWPTMTPVASSYDWMLNGATLKPTGDGGLVAILEGESFEPDPLPKTDKIGALFQVKIGGEWVRTEIYVPMPWAAADTPVMESTSPLWSDQGSADAAQDTRAAPEEDSTPMGLNLFWAFLGGLLLNVMPCVLPVLTLKLYSLVEQTDINAAEQRVAGAAYTAGILASFWLLAAAVIILRVSFGLDVNWGFQFQYPPYVAGLTVVVFAFGLSLFGVFEIPTIGGNQAMNASAKEGPVGYFFTGVFATLLATPCSAPFLGTAVAVAFTAPTHILFLIFTMVGLGLAFPFLLIAFVPAMYRLLPKPGAWMESFKHLLGFTLVVTSVWLVGVLTSQVGNGRAVLFMYELVAIALGCWAFGRMAGPGKTGRQTLAGLGVGLAIPLLAANWLVDLEMDTTPVCDDGSVAAEMSFEESVPWQAFTEERVAALKGKTVFIDFTADWCLTCKANEKAILETKPVRESMRDNGVVPLKADWTKRDPVITEWLRRYQRAGVPFYLVLPADPTAAPIALPEVITAGMVMEAFKEAAGPSAG